MFVIRRTAFRALSNPSTSLLLKTRSITTVSRPSILGSPRILTSSRLQRRFLNEDAEHRQLGAEDSPESSSINESTISSAVETAKAAASNAAETITSAAASSIGLGAADIDQTSAPSIYATHTMPDGSPVPPTTNVFCGNLLYEITEDDLFAEMEKFGNVKSTKIIKDAHGRSRGFGYTLFADVESASRAIEGLHGRVYGGRRIAVQFSNKGERQPTPPKNTPTKTLFIGNLSFESTDKDLNQLFGSLPNCLDVRVAIDRRTGAPRGFAHADFLDEESALSAMNVLRGKSLQGRTLRVDFGTNARGKPQQAEE